MASHEGFDSKDLPCYSPTFSVRSWFHTLAQLDANVRLAAFVVSRAKVTRPQDGWTMNEDQGR